MMLSELASQLDGLTPADGRFDGLLKQIEQLANAGDTDACLTAGHLHTQYPGLRRAGSSARHFYELSARAGHPLAVERLADLFLTGSGIMRDRQKAYSMYRQLSAWMFPHVLCQVAYMELTGTGCDVNLKSALELLSLAALQQDRLACGWLHHLETLRQNEAGSDPASEIEAGWHNLLALTGDLRYSATEEALESELEALLQGDPQNLAAGLQSFAATHKLFEALPVDTAMRAIDAMPTTVEMHSEPRLYRIDNALNCFELIYLDQLAMQTQANDQGNSGEPASDSVDMTVPDWSAQPVQRLITEKLATLMHMPASAFEAITVISVPADHRTDARRDYLTQAEQVLLEHAGDCRGQRLATLMMTIGPEPLGLELENGAEQFEVESGQVWVQYAVTPDGLIDQNSHFRIRNAASECSLSIRMGLRERSTTADRYITL